MPLRIADNVVIPMCVDSKKEPLVSLACAEVEGKPLLVWNIEGLRSVGLREINVLVGPHRERVEKILRTAGLMTSGLKICYAEAWDKGDGAALLELEDILESRPFLFLNPTCLMSPELADRLAVWPVENEDREAVAAGTVLGEEGKAYLPGMDVEGGGAVKKSNNGKMKTGLYSMDSAVFPLLKNMRNGGRLLVADVFEKLQKQGRAGVLTTDTDHCLPVCDVRDLSMVSAFLTGIGALPGVTERYGVENPTRVLGYIKGILEEKAGLHYTLMNPGPVLTTARVKSAMVHHDICHRDEEFPKVVRRLRRKLKIVFGGGPEHEVLLITGSGTSGMEAAVSSSVPHDKKLLIVSNGAFGERFMEIAEQHRLNFETIRYEWGEPVDPEDIRRALSESDEIFAVAMCHHETSVGLINPIREVGGIVRDFDRLFIVDAVASLGAEELNVRKDKIDICVSSANKCLHSTSGVATICVSLRAWKRMEEVRPRVYYLNLKRYRDYAVEREETPFTPTVSGFFALDAAVDELLADGVEARAAVYKMRNEKIRNRFKMLGLEFFSSTGRESRTITCVKVPSYIAFEELYQEMKRRGYLIYNSKEHLKNKYFQVANMGDLSDETIESFLTALEMVLIKAKSGQSKYSSFVDKRTSSPVALN